MKLNLGSGKDYREGWVNVDSNPRFKPDVLMDIRDLEYENGTIHEILAQDVIDHVTFMEAKALLRKCFEWLKPLGTLNIHTPNLRTLGPEAAWGNVTALEWMYGSRGEGNTAYETNVTRWCYSPVSLTELLEKLGFEVIGVTPTCLGMAFRMIAVKPENGN